MRFVIKTQADLDRVHDALDKFLHKGDEVIVDVHAFDAVLATEVKVLAAYMKREDLTLRVMGSQLGVSHVHLSKLVRGMSTCSPSLKDRIRDFLRIRGSQLTPEEVHALEF
jgi:hypothetical protein